MKLSNFLEFARFGLKTILLGKKDPILGTVIVTDKCNLKCRHCSVNNITAVVHPYSQIKKEMEQLYKIGIRILFFCGGETFLWRDGDMTIRDLVCEAKKMGFLIVNVVTNGTFPIDLPEADLILLSLDGDRDRHNAVRGDTYDTIMENIRNATSDNICFYMGTAAFKILRDNSVIADQRECLNNDLSIIAGIGKGLKIACHSGSEYYLTNSFADSAKAFALKNCAVFKN